MGIQIKSFVLVFFLGTMLSGCAFFSYQERIDRANSLLDQCYENQTRAIVVIDSLVTENARLKQELEQCRDQ